MLELFEDASRQIPMPKYAAIGQIQEVERLRKWYDKIDGAKNKRAFVGYTPEA